MCEINWKLLFELITAIGSLATFGTFLFLFFKDKQKQDQIDKLTNIFEELQIQNKLNEKKFKVSLRPSLYLHGSTLNGTDGNLIIKIHNKGETAKILNCLLKSEDILSLNQAFPMELDKGKNIELPFKTKGIKNINDCDYELNIFYEDNAQNKYSLVIVGKGISMKITKDSESL
jgi:hypothetical protein